MILHSTPHNVSLVKKVDDVLIVWHLRTNKRCNRFCLQIPLRAHIIKLLHEMCTERCMNLGCFCVAAKSSVFISVKFSHTLIKIKSVSQHQYSLANVRHQWSVWSSFIVSFLAILLKIMSSCGDIYVSNLTVCNFARTSGLRLLSLWVIRPENGMLIYLLKAMTHL